MAEPAWQALQKAAETFRDAAILGDGIEQALHDLARATGAKGGNLIVCSRDQCHGGFASAEVADTQSRYYGGERPADCRFTRVRTGAHSGFRADFDDFQPEELLRDPYYQEFLRPEDLFWHATVWLSDDGDRSLELSLKRSPRGKAFAPAEIAALDAILPSLRASARIARLVRNAEAEAAEQVLLSRGQPVFEFDGERRYGACSRMTN